MTDITLQTTYSTYIRSNGGTRTKMYAGYNKSTTGSSYNAVGVQYSTSSSYRGYQTFGRLSIGAIPAGALITNVSVGRYYGVANHDTSPSFRMEVYDYDWGTSVSTADWRIPTTIASYYSSGLRLCYDDTTWSSQGWKEFVMDGTHFADRLQLAVNAQDTYFNFGVFSDHMRTSYNYGTNDPWVDVYQYGSLGMKWTISYVLPDLQTIQLGTTF